MKALYLGICLLLSIGLGAQAPAAQAPVFQDVVYLKNGSVLRGTISEYVLGAQLKIKTVTGFEMTVPDSSIQKVEQEQVKMQVAGYVKTPRPYAFREKGWYAALEVGPAFNIDRLGGDIRLSTGWMLHRLVGFGLGGGFDSYEVGSYSPIFPIYAEMRGYLFPMNKTPFYNVKIGHGIAGGDRSDGADIQKGGFFFHPQIGMRLGGREKGLNWTLSAGVKWQRATYTYFWNWPERSIREYRHLSSTLTIGALF